MKNMFIALVASIFCAAPALANEDIYANEAAVPSEELNQYISNESLATNDEGQVVATEIEDAMSAEELDAMDVEQAGDQDMTSEEASAEMDVMRRHGGTRVVIRPGHRHGHGRVVVRPGHRHGRVVIRPGRPGRVIIRPGRPGPIIVRPANVTCFAQNGRGMVFRASGNRPGVVQTRALNKCYAQSRNCRPMGCR